MSKTIEIWSSVMGDVFKELYRITKIGGTQLGIIVSIVSSHISNETLYLLTRIILRPTSFNIEHINSEITI